MRVPGILSTLAGVLVVSATLATTAPAQSGSSPLSDEEKELNQVEGSVVELQRAISAARKRGDDPERLGKLRKKFDKLQKKRVGLLQATWQM